MLSALQFWNGLSTQGKVATATAIALPVLYGAKKFFAGGVNKHRPDLTGKVALITGANTGIGLETAKYLAKLNCEVLVTVRDDPKGRETTGKIKEVVPNAKADYFKVELSSLKSVRNFVEEYKKRTNNKKIDFLIENAGVMVRLEKLHLTIKWVYLNSITINIVKFPSVLRLMFFFGSDSAVHENRRRIRTSVRC
jgi:NAD(P)-dependent dehydrogenase (short-subunit alcohol dehydrogenase family)